MSTTRAFAIRHQEGWEPRWVIRRRIAGDTFATTLMTTCRSHIPPKGFLYADQDHVERDAERLRAEHARDTARTTFTVLVTETPAA